MQRNKILDALWGFIIDLYQPVCVLSGVFLCNQQDCKGGDYEIN